MLIPFEKWHGCRNNFIVVFSNVNQTYLVPSLQREAAKLCNKDGSSIGADGILVLEYPESTSFHFAPNKLIIINSDGSIAKNCGNGLRCAALACYKRAKDANQDAFIPDSFELNVEGVNFFCRFLESSSRSLPFVSVTMGVPQLDQNNSWHTEAVTAVQNFFKKNTKSPNLEEIHTCSISNNHIVVFGDELNKDFFNSLGPSMQQGFSWDGINIHLVKNSEEDPKKIAGPKGLITTESMICDVLHWERGVGLTAACGSGASSVAASLFAQGFLSENDCVIVRMPGGNVFIRQKTNRSPIEMIGPAKFVFKGHLDI